MHRQKSWCVNLTNVTLPDDVFDVSFSRRNYIFNKPTTKNDIVTTQESVETLINNM